MAKCILRGVDITPENDSAAHIIPSALGGRLKPTGLLCQEANTDMDEKFDNELIRAYQPFMVLVGGSRDKSGELAPFFATAQDGQKYKIYEDRIEATKPEYIKTQRPDGQIEITVKARTFKEARTLLGRVKSEFPHLNVDVEQVLAQAEIRKVDIGKINFQMQFGPITTFPAAFGMASIFSAWNGLPIHPQFVDYVRNFDVGNRTLPPDTFYFLHQCPWFYINADVAHCLILCSDASRNQSLFFVQIFNQPGVAVLLPFAGSSDICHTYGVNVLEGQTATVTVDENALRSLAWSSTHSNGDPDLWKAVESCSKPLIALASQKSLHREHDQIIDRLCGGKRMNLMTPIEKETYLKELRQLLERALPEGMSSSDREAAIRPTMKQI